MFGIAYTSWRKSMGGLIRVCVAVMAGFAFVVCELIIMALLVKLVDWIESKNKEE